MSPLAPHLSPDTTPTPTPKRGIKRGGDVAILAYGALLLLSVVLVSARLDGLGAWVALLLAAPLCWMAADLCSGLVHWSLDSYGNTDTLLFGPIIDDFREHHDLPREILKKDFRACIASVCLLAAPGMLLIHLATFWLESPLLLGILTLFIAGCVLTNYIHRLAHEDHIPAWARALQRSGLFLSVAEHQRHHRGDRRRAYCITCGWMNPVLERARFFARLEALIAWTTGVRPAGEPPVRY